MEFLNPPLTDLFVLNEADNVLCLLSPAMMGSTRSHYQPQPQSCSRETGSQSSEDADLYRINVLMTIKTLEEAQTEKNIIVKFKSIYEGRLKVMERLSISVVLL